MVFAYALLGVEPYREEALAVFDLVPDILVPDSFRSELVNVVWQWSRVHDLALERGIEVLADADALITHSVSTERLWERALQLATKNDHPAYDTLFVALAESWETRLVTYDSRLLRKFSDRSISPAQLVR